MREQQIERVKAKLALCRTPEYAYLAEMTVYITHRHLQTWDDVTDEELARAETKLDVNIERARKRGEIK